MSEAAGQGPSELTKRAISGIVMGVAAIATTAWGGWPFALLWIGVSAAVAWEWQSIVCGSSSRRPAFAGAFGVVLILTPILLPVPWVVAAAMVLLAAAANAWPPPGASPPLRALGLFYALALGLGAILCRSTGSEGATVIFWLFAVVWGTDIIAYFTGRSLGGPKLWLRVSPKKTWSGAIGGLAGGVLLGCLLLAAFGTTLRWQHVALSIAFSILTQLGDLFESALKRRFGVKDSGSLIPGHGGFMDRLDGFIFAVAFAAGFGALRAGPLQVPSGLLDWP